jgi:hypothetical protein
MAKAQFTHPEGDHLTMLNVYHAFKSSESRETGLIDHRTDSLNAIQQTSKTSSGHGTTSCPSDLYSKPTTFGPNCEDRWRVSPAE